MSDKLKKRKSHLHPSFWELFLSIPKSFFFNLKVLPFKKAIKMPIIVSCKTKIIGANKKTFVVNLPGKVKFGLCRLGLSGSESGYIIPKKSLVLIRNGGKVVFNGLFGISRGAFLHCDDGLLTFGNNFKANYYAHISCEHSTISFGDNCSLGWECTVKSFDGHHMFCLNGNQSNKNYGPISIGNHCWICSRTTILKNGWLGNNCVLAYGSILTKQISIKDNLLYAGQPAKIIRENIDWKV